MKPIIYELVVRYFGNTNTTNATDGTLETNGCGKFVDINESALRALKDLGVTHVWLTGCLRQATLTSYPELGLEADHPDVVKGRAGSLYAIRDEFDVCPDYAIQPARRLPEFEALVGRIHEAGLRVLIDFVPNHVARGYHSQVRPDLDFGLHDNQSQFWSPRNHFYYLVEPPGQSLRLEKPAHWNPTGVTFDGRFAPEDGGPGRVSKATGNNQTSPLLSVRDWYETVKLNYGFDFVQRHYQLEPPPPVWRIMDQVLAYWQSKGVDGFRCDFAHYIPQQAWTFLIGRARARSADVWFMAEAYPFPNSGDPITEAQQLLDAGFDAFYLDESYERLKSIYRGAGDQDHYDQLLVLLPEAVRQKSVQYLENHDERRIASPIEPQLSSDNSGFGSMKAGYQLAPLQFLYGCGPVLLLNGQEVGEPGAGEEGFGGEDGRTTIYDYWAMPEFAKWVNQHRYDGALLSSAQSELRGFYRDLLRLCQDPAIRGEHFWGLKYFNRPERFADCPADLYSYARYAQDKPRLLLVTANFRPGAGIAARVRIPAELASAAGLQGSVQVRLLLDRTGARDELAHSGTVRELIEQGFLASLPNQSAHVYSISPPG